MKYKSNKIIDFTFFDTKLHVSTNFAGNTIYNKKEVIKVETYIFSVITATIIGFVTYLVAKSGNKKDIEMLKMQNTSDMEKLMNQHKIDIEAMKEKHKLELELKEVEQKYKLELLKLENENEIKKTTEIANNASMNTATNQIFGNIFGRECVQKQLDNAIEEAFKNAKAKGEENKGEN